MKASELVPVEANENIPDFGPGDTVRVNFRIREGNRERVQAFQGVCIRRTHGKGPAANFTVRRITAGIGIERVFPLHSPLIESLEVTRQGKVRRARLYYLRGTSGARGSHQGKDHLPQQVNYRLRIQSRRPCSHGTVAAVSLILSMYPSDLTRMG